MKTVLLTGSCGFIFANFIRQAIDWEDYRFVCIDKIIAPYNRNNIFHDKRQTFYLGDIADEQFVHNVFQIEKPDIVIHGAAESFVDDSIRSAKPFVHSNIVGTQVLVDEAVNLGVERFIYISTDEVYGHLLPGDKAAWDELAVPNPRNPYSATKYCGERIVYAANQTHGLPYNITRSSNCYGPRQPPRNLVPKVITCLRDNLPIPIHGDGSNVREWTYVDDKISAIQWILHAPLNEIYNIGSGFQCSNFEMVYHIARLMKKQPKIEFIPDRKGHDFSYHVQADKLKALGWMPNKLSFDNRMTHTINWYLENSSFYA